VCMTWEVDASRRLLYRATPRDDWQELEHFMDERSRFQPVGFTEDDQALIVLSNVKRDTDALYIYEPAKKALTELVFEAPKGLDVSSAVFSTYGGRLVAARYNDGGGRVVFFDAPTARAHKAVSNLFPDSRVSVTSMSRDGKRAVVLVTSGSEPGTFLLVDDEKQRVAELVRRAPWLKDARYGITKAIEYQARDQTRIAGFITYPAGRELRSLPMIVNPHGGPYGVQDTGSYDREAQFFASRGYAVLQVNFRGSGGYGTAFRTAGYREWGKKMQDDITDGVLWAIKEGIADKDRIGIYGASYGGYAAMMGLVRSPELFRCGITFAGVSDLDMLLNTTAIRGSTSKVYIEIPKEARRIWEDMLGDRKDEETLRAASPRYNVAAIRAPVMIAHGEDDFTVPFAHATALRDELLKAGKPVEFFGVREEGHGFRDPANRAQLFARIEKFLAQHLPPGTPAAP
jgi:dipeptidyl aminopeptidase/acylaminoacyl peptidase